MERPSLTIRPGFFDALAATDTETDSFTYTVSDGNGSTSTATVSIDVTGTDAAQPVSAFDDGELPSGFTINGISAFDYSGISVSSAGDVNQDGIDDLIIGASGADQPGATTAGEAYIVFGSTEAPGNTLELAELDGNRGFVLTGVDGGGTAGFSVSHAGDVNSDGIDDIVIGAPEADADGEVDNGVSYVVFGNAGGFGPSLDLGSLDGTNGFEIAGEASFDASGTTVSSAGDVNNDNIDDLLITAPSATGALAGAGKSYIVFGSDTDFDASLDLAALDGTDGFEIQGINTGDYSGFSASAAGDVNGDGIDDIVIGARYADPSGVESGQTYVVFGASSFAASIQLAALEGSNGFIINGADAGDG
ncbi:MAG: VCBS domain-containing protein, partial [Pseudomonadota bacterium]